ncbi:cupin domain-containing protein [Pontibacter locisalis]|uniref:Cupin domain-containing protein n=1 Tax=Pontibacter locisalis TaxID=1719035 RepID=A0ABW5IF98_9BACT
MSPIKEFIESGVLELYVLGATTPEQNLEVEQMAAAHAVVRQELDEISLSMENYALANAVKPKETVKPLLLASIDYIERMKKGELPAIPPVVTEESRAEEYAQWVNREDMTLPADADEIYAKIIGYTPAAITAIVWIKKDMSEYEVHHDENERFLILEGTCDMIVEGEVFKLKAGDFFAVPLHARHKVKITSEVPCKAVLQRLSIN